MLWEKVPGSLPLRPGITVEKVENHNRAEALAIISGERAWGTTEALGQVFAQEYEHPDVVYWLARKDGTPAAAGFMFRQGSIGRIDSFRTLPQFRRQGLATALIQHIQQEFLRQGGTSLYTCRLQLPWLLKCTMPVFFALWVPLSESLLLAIPK
jgi:ribosomal protein S18 acetylase RimI-like enzyme